MSKSIYNRQIDIKALTNAEYKNTASDFTVHYGFHSSIFGNCLIALAKDKVCYLAFTDDQNNSLHEISLKWPNVNIIEDKSKTLEIVNLLFTHPKDTHSKIPVLIKGTDYQIKVWKMLLTVPFGAKTSYEDIAKKAGNIKAVRAVANCIAKNDVSFLIPCHRVVKKSGEIHKYRWGNKLKAAILQWEADLLIN